MLKLPKLSIAAKLYSIFALFAVVSALLGIISNISTHQQAHLGEEVAITARAAENIERVNGLIYAVVMESRGVYMSSDLPTVKKYGDGLLVFNDRIAKVVADWQTIVRADDAEQFAAFAKRIEQFREFRKELVRRAIEIRPEAGREWGDNDANRSVRTALNKDLEAFAKIYAERTRRLGALTADARLTSWTVTGLAAAAFILVAMGVIVIWRAITRPLSAITRTTERVAAGDSDLAVPCTERHDEVGALARAIEVFQRAMRHNQELSRKAADEAEARAARARHVESLVEDFRVSVDEVLRSLADNSAAMRKVGQSITGVAGDASSQADAASGASRQASSNVAAVAGAAEELAAALAETGRQVTQASNVVRDADAKTARSVTEIDGLAAASERIGAVLSLIQAIAAQTNLLALNATIEAARAGEAGRGFAVVAQEVKTLAGQTAKATGEIAEQIAAIQGSTKSAVAAVREIGQSMSGINEVTSAIAAAIEEQGLATKEISSNAQMAAQVNESLAANIASVNSAIGATRDSAGTVLTASGQLAGEADKLTQAVTRFFERLRSDIGQEPASRRSA
ncbi:MAG TPA: methyl-accepting chemotaxis protein [Xanthobacteraceae bacterium]|nr:methyl-accepting chemotaxis protein [Xanthobacteraceae bacterium]